jgi:hypothetical protein
MNLAQALKQKNRLAGELTRLQEIFQRENSRRNDNPSTVKPEEIWSKIQEVSEQLGVLKAKIATANVGIYSAIERMAELKGRIAYVKMVPKREGEEVEQPHYGSTAQPTKYTWTAFMNQQQADTLVFDLQKQIDTLQDQVDAYNATTQI